MSNGLTDLISESNIKYGHRSDHSIIELEIQLNKFQRGPGTWEFNSNLLRNKTYVELINNTIDETITEYAVSVNKIRGKTISFFGKEKKKQNQKEEELINDIEKLESDDTLCNLLTLIEDKKTELQ